MQIRSFSSFPVKLNSSLPKAGPYLRYLLKIPTNLKLHSNNLADPPKATEKPLYTIAQLVVAIYSDPHKKATLADIAEAIKSHCECFRKNVRYNSS